MYDRAKIYNSDGKLAIEMGISEWFMDSLITVYGQTKNAYMWNGAYIPSRVEWEVQKMVAEENNESFLSTKLNKQGLSANMFYNSVEKKQELSIYIDTNTQATWNVYLGNGRFSVSDREVKAAYIEAGTFVKNEIVGKRFDEIVSSDFNVVVYFSNRGSSVGVWKNGDMKLTGE